MQQNLLIAILAGDSVHYDFDIPQGSVSFGFTNS